MSGPSPNFPIPDELKPVEIGPVDIDYSTREGFLALFEELVVVLENDLNEKGHDLATDAVQYLVRMMKYNLPKGKLNRGLTVVSTFKELKKDATNEEIKRVAVLGWCIEWIQASFLVSDDIMDSSVTRRGQPCWYKNKDVGFIAINDALILLVQTEVLLHKYFNYDVQLFSQLHSLLIATIYQTEMGQNLDMSTQPLDKTKVDLNLYTQKRYDMIVKYKTAYYSFYAPIALGMIPAGKNDQESLDAAMAICLKMGRYFQIQDDYLDVYGSPEVIGKIGTDIQDAKCSWLVVQALNEASEEQRAVLTESYGKDDKADIEKVKVIFEELNLTKKYLDFEEQSYIELKKDIEECTILPSEIFLKLLHKIYKRSK